MKDALRNSGFPARALRLEVTESIAISDPDRVRTVLKELRALGDQGQPRRLRHRLLLAQLSAAVPRGHAEDRSIVCRADWRARRPDEIIRLLVGLARTLGLDVVAEGIETDGQLEYLTGLGCGYGQGYYFRDPRAPKTSSRPSRHHKCVGHPDLTGNHFPDCAYRQ